ncbi:MAG: hypothetical protein SH857_17095 [Chitinophagales bacterium]|nr:hypothetical protein [Chitinophagales bacterium]
MPPRTASIKAIKVKEPVVVLNLREYEKLIEYVEDLEDRVSVRERANEPNVPYEKVEKRFKRKFGKK